ncbi:hypothetical protein OC188_00855 [Anaplasma capra]|uniref:hypothetical protein n=1 Tax=Anaplasma capra TaxID=1562740 RepID=UPI0021D5BF26|nr:hypothetical protein [Anaplasma capra]MCU7611256.1 hypothetical protein [Anaplasma capra]
METLKQLSTEVSPSATQAGGTSGKSLSATTPCAEDRAASFGDIERDFGHVFYVQDNALDQLQIKLAIHSTEPLADRTKEYIDREIRSTIGAFDASFALGPHNTPRQLDVYVFEHSRNLKDSLERMCVDGNVGGIAWPSLGKIYVYKEGSNKVANLPHELSHCLFDYAVSGKYGWHAGVDILNEGVGEHIQHIVERGYEIDLDIMRRADRVLSMFRDDAEIAQATNLNDIMSIIRERSPQDYRYVMLKYDLGITLVNYLQRSNPSLIKEAFRNSAATSFGHNTLLSDAKLVADPFSTLMSIPEGFSAWLSENSTEQFVAAHDALFVRPNELVGLTDKLVDGEIKQIKVFDAVLEDSAGNVVSALSPVSHFGFHSVIRVANMHSGDKFDLHHRYHFLKPVVTHGVLKYTYCDDKGQEYLMSRRPEVVSSLTKIVTKYDSDVAMVHEAVLRAQAAYDTYLEKQDEQSERAVHEAVDYASVLLTQGLDKIATDHMDFAAIAGTELENQHFDPRLRTTMLGAAYTEYITKHVQSLMLGLEDSEASVVLQRILHHMMYIDPMRMRAVSGAQTLSQQHDVILSLKAMGKGDMSGVSVYLPDGEKVAELPSDSEAFTQYTHEHEGLKMNFIAADSLKATHTVYSTTPVVVVQLDEQGNKAAYFVRGTKASEEESDIVVDVDVFLDPKVLKLSGDDQLSVSHGLKVRSLEKTPEEHHDVTARKSVMADDKGTERTSDDTYDAAVYSNNKVAIQKLSSLEFYMSAAREDASNDVVQNPAFFIRDVAAGKTLQFPDSITHLKLIRTDNGSVRLVPCTKDGNVSPPDMPYNTKGYTYIDPIFAYTRIKADWISKHAKLDLVDFTRYDDGTLFKLQWNRDDPRLPRDKNGEIIWADDLSYFTRAELIYEPENTKIGELSSSPSLFQDCIFLSFDRNYDNSDFVSSLHEQEVELQNGGDGTQRVSLTGKNDLGTDHGYSDYYSLFHRQEQDSKELADEIHRRAGVVDMQSGEAGTQVRKVSVSEHDLQQLENTVVYWIASEEIVDGQVVHQHDLFINNNSGQHYFQLPKAITHLKVVTHNGQKHLVPSTESGVEDPDDMPQDLGEHRYINAALAHENVAIDHTQRIPVANISLVDLEKYEDGTLLELRTGGNISYSGIGAVEDGRSKTVHLFDEHGNEIGVLSKYPNLLGDRISFGIREETAPDAQSAEAEPVTEGVPVPPHNEETYVHNSAHDDALDNFLRARHSSSSGGSAHREENATHGTEYGYYEVLEAHGSAHKPCAEPSAAGGGTNHCQHHYTDDALIDSVAWETRCDTGLCHVEGGYYGLLPL